MRRTVPDFSPDGLKRRLQDLERSVADLHRKGTPRSSVGGEGGGPMVIDMGDTAVYTGYSKAHYATSPVTLSTVIATVDSAGTTDTTANVFVGSSYVGDVTIPAGQNVSEPLAVGASLAAGSYWRALVTVAGVNASGLTFFGSTG